MPLLALAFIVCAGGARVRAQVLDGLDFVMRSSLPPEIVTALSASATLKPYVLQARLNPFYLQGDFDADGKLDTALLVKHKSSGKVGIAILAGATGTVTVLGAGRELGNGGDDFAWLDAWYVQRRVAVARGAIDAHPPKLLADALVVQKTESASAVVCWDGKRYVWRQQGD